MFGELRELLHQRESRDVWCRVLEIVYDHYAGDDVAIAYVREHTAGWSDAVCINPEWLEEESALWGLVRCLRLEGDQATDDVLARWVGWGGLDRVRCLELCEPETTARGLEALGRVRFGGGLRSVVLKRTTVSERVMELWRESGWFAGVSSWGFERCLLTPDVLEMCLQDSGGGPLDDVLVEEEEGYGEVPAGVFGALARSGVMCRLRGLALGPVVCDEARIGRWVSSASRGVLERLCWSAALGCGASMRSLVEVLGAPWSVGLRELVLRGHDVVNEGVAALQRAVVSGRLRVLSVEGANLQDEDAYGLVRYAAPSLRALSFANNRLTNRGVQALASAPGLRGVEVLDVSGNAIYEDGVCALLESRVLERLRVLDVGYSRVRPGERERLKKIAVNRGVSLRLAMPFEGARGAIRVWGVER